MGRVILFGMVLIMAGCATTPPTVQPKAKAVVQVSPVPAWLDQAFEAMQRNHLSEPYQDSAAQLYNAVLQHEPDNGEARRGLSIVTGKYQDMAARAIAGGHYHVAADYLLKADSVIVNDAKTMALANEMAQLQSAKSDTTVYNLDQSLLVSQSPVIVADLQKIAASIQVADVTAVIYAPNDRLGRWIYQQLNDYSLEYRVRGDLRVSVKPRIELAKPRS